MGPAAAVLSIIGTVYQFSEQRKAAKEARKAAAERRKAEQVKQKIADIRAERERRALLARSRVAQAQAIAAGFAGGIGQGSSAVLGTLSGLRSSAAGEIGFSSQVQGLSQQVSIFNIQAAQYDTNALTHSARGRAFGGLARGLGSIFSSSFSAGGGGGGGGSLNREQGAGLAGLFPSMNNHPSVQSNYQMWDRVGNRLGQGGYFGDNDGPENYSPYINN